MGQVDQSNTYEAVLNRMSPGHARQWVIQHWSQIADPITAIARVEGYDSAAHAVRELYVSQLMLNRKGGK